MHPEVQRRLVHASGVTLPLSYISGILTWEQLRICFVLGTLFVLTWEGLRLSGRIGWFIFERLTREYEHDHVAGYALYMFGSTSVVLVFRPSIALPAVLMLMVADPVSGLLGSDTDSDPDPVSTVKPTYILCLTFVICTLIALPFVHPIPAICGAIAATAADGAKPVIDGYVIDDNLTIPPAAAVAIVGGQNLLGYLLSVS